MNRRQALPWIALAALATVSGCISTRIEYDRMAGTAFPPDQTVGGKTVTIPSIYATESYLVGVSQDETNIAALTGPNNPADPNQYDYITEAELNTLESGHRSTPVAKTSWICFNLGIVPTWCTEYHIYGIVVNHYSEDDNGVRDKSVMGLMWADDNRRAFTNYYRNATVSGDGGKYLRSAAHEIGHAFNLHHPDGDGSTDIMNQTGVVGNNYVYQFVAAASKNHLKDHPDQCKYPSLSAFGAVHTNHVDHGYTTATCR
jgi:hypothetical protein